MELWNGKAANEPYGLPNYFRSLLDNGLSMSLKILDFVSKRGVLFSIALMNHSSTVATSVRMANQRVARINSYRAKSCS